MADFTFDVIVVGGSDQLGWRQDRLS